MGSCQNTTVPPSQRLGGTVYIIYQLQRTIQVKVCPSTVHVMVVVPLPTAVTLPSEPIVATEVLPMLQEGVELVPLTFMVKVCPADSSVKSSRFSEREPLEELLPEELEAAPLVTPLRTVQV